jgi:hypothetical protein
VVPIERSLAVLATHLQALREVLSAAQVTIAEDKPNRTQSALADAFENSVVDALGYTQEALAHAASARTTVAGPFDFVAARRYLGKSQEAFRKVTDCYFSQMVAHERLTDLDRLAAKPGSEWQVWAESLKMALHKCCESVDAANQAFMHCWEDLTEALTIALMLRPEPASHAEPPNSAERQVSRAKKRSSPKNR